MPVPAPRFPDGFLWGCATSSFQVEGDNRNCDWWDWEQRPRAIDDGSRSGAACGWWSGRARDDLAVAAARGQNAHRLGLEWSRLEPVPGTWDEAAFARYGEILDAIRGLGMTPMVTLNHFTLPRWASAGGGWIRGDLPRRFAAFAAEAVRRLHRPGTLWVTLNEPNVLALAGYATRNWPPALGSLRAGARAFAAQLEAHASARAAVRQVRPDAPVGIVMNLPVFEPARPESRLDRAAAAAHDHVFNGAGLDALRTGRIPPPYAPLGRVVPGLAGSLDFFGLNYYGRYRVRVEAAAWATGGMRHVQEPTVRGRRVDWGEPHAPSLGAQLIRLGALGVPLYVSENGIRDARDDVRGEYLRGHVRAVGEAIRAGADVRGYFHWSLVDNFEWGEGWSARFGLLAMDPVTQQRVERPSMRVFEAICRSGGAAAWDAGADEPTAMPAPS